MHSRRERYLIGAVLTVRVLLTLHIVWTYIKFSSDLLPWKGGTIIESTTQSIGYLPYLSLSDSDKFYQSLLFKSCLFPTFSGSSTSYYEELCSVKTSDYKSFEVTALPGHAWADGTSFNLWDVFFTYSSLLADNYRSIPGLETYKNIEVALVDSRVTVTFPQASIDNMIFFTNFILPQHLLANTSRDDYISKFGQSPVGTSCVHIKPTTHDTSSVVFDFESCKDIPLKYYQVKQFPNLAALTEYTAQHEDDVSFVTADEQIPWFVANPVILNNYATIFFNTKQPWFTLNMRRKLTSRIYDVLQSTYDSTGTNSYIVADTFLFPRLQTTAISAADFVSSSSGNVASSTTNPTNNNLPQLPTSLTFGGAQEAHVYILPYKIVDKMQLQFTFTTKYDKVSVAHNGGKEYFPESYNAATSSTLYNLNPLFRNVIQGTNTYTIRAYLQGKVVDTFTLEVRYMDGSVPTNPTTTTPTPTTPTTVKHTLKVIYGNDKLSLALARDLKNAAVASGIDEYMNFEQFADPAAFAGKLQSKDYDLVITPIAMGLRKDMSNLFLSEDPSINPSLFTNLNIAERINTYFLKEDIEEKQRIKKNISDIYQDTVPLVILGKEKWVFLINENLEFSFPFRLYARGRRKDFLNELSVYSERVVDWNRVNSWANMLDFLRTYGLGK